MKAEIRIEEDSLIGEVTSVSAGIMEFKLNNKRAKTYSTKYGSNSNPLNVGQYVIVESLKSLILAQITFVGSNILTSHDSPAGTTVKSQILGSYSTVANKTERGVVEYPMIGQQVYVASPEVTSLFISSDEAGALIGKIETLNGLDVKLPFKDLFSRHCVVVGNTGGGKSWTISRLLEENIKKGLKTILLDATGEFYTFPEVSCEHLVLTSENTSEENGELVHFDYKKLTEEDLFAFFTPSQQAQASVLREAIKTLKLVEAGHLTANNGVGNFTKSAATRTAYENALAQAGSDVFTPYCTLDINNLRNQIELECVDPSSWSENRQLKNYNQTLIMRIETRLNASEFGCIFKPRGRPSVTDKIEAFVQQNDKKLLRISLRDLPFDFYTREIVVNALTRFLMTKARVGMFKQNPAVLAVDEAHNFFKAKAKIGDEMISLNSLDLVAKEGRKFGLMLLIGTQRPKDIPSGAMSQIGALFCHRITNEDDVNLIKYNVSEINRTLLERLSLLRQGEVLLTTFKLPFPLVISVAQPTFEPESRDPEI